MITTYSLSIYEKTKKVCLLLALLVAEVGSMNAQTSVTPDKYKVETNSFSSIYQRRWRGRHVLQRCCPKQSCYCKRINKREKNVNIRVKENKSDEKNKMKFKEKDEKTFNDIKEQNDRQIVNY